MAALGAAKFAVENLFITQGKYVDKNHQGHERTAKR
jgi:hypothetical protein